MLRASAIVEQAGIPTASLICDGFIGQANAIAGGFGVPGMPVARLVGHVDSQSEEELTRNLREVTAGDVIRWLTEVPVVTEVEAGDAPVSGTGSSFEAVNAHFLDRGWSDGLPIVPPTASRVTEFLARTPHAADEEIGVLLPSGRVATVQNVAVNGVMAGCDPATMPVLVAIAEALADPGYGVQHSGDTTGGEALVILSGPAIQRLGFNHGAAALRDGDRANTTVGRFLRLLLRNVAGIRADGADKSTFGNTWRVVLAEDEAAAQNLGWPTFGMDRGFDTAESAVTIARYTGGGVVGSVYGRTADEIVPYLADGLVRQVSWEMAFTVGFAPGTYRPLLVISPLIADTLARDGLSKQGLQQRLHQEARMPARKMEQYIGPWANLVPGRRSLADLVRDGLADPQFAESNDPERLVPIAVQPEDFHVVISGDPLRSNAYAFGHNGMHGFPTSRTIRFVDR